MKYPRLSFALISMFTAGMLCSLFLLLSSTEPSALPAQIASLSLLLLSLSLVLEFRILVLGIQKISSGTRPENWLRALVILIFLLLLILWTRKNERLLDFSADGLHQVQEDTIKILKEVQPDFLIFATRKTDPDLYLTLERFFEVLQSFLPLRVQWFDPSERPAFSQKMGIRAIPSVILRIGSDQRTLNRSSLFSTAGRQNAFHGERAIVQTIKTILNPAEVTLVFPERGNGRVLDSSPAGYSLLFSLLKAEGFQTSVQETIPRTKSPALVFLPPQMSSSALGEDLYQRLQNKDKTILLMEPSPKNPFEDLRLPGHLQELVFLGLPVVDPLRNAGSELSFLLPHFGSHPCVKGLDPKYPVLFPGASAFSFPTQNSKTILKSSSFSWAEIPTGHQKLPVFEPEKEPKGPLRLALGIDDYLILFADQDFLANQFLMQPGNQSLILRSIHFLTGSLQKSFSKPKILKHRPLQVPENTKQRWIVTLLILLPLTALCIGGLIAFFQWRESLTNQ